MARDKKILDLVDVINDTLSLILQGNASEQLGNIEVYKEIFKCMALQIVECGYFILAYVEHDFCKCSLCLRGLCLMILYVCQLCEQ